MSCTAEQIAEKRRIAQELRARKQTLSSSLPSTPPTTTTQTSAATSNSNNSAHKFLSSGTFYSSTGSSSESAPPPFVSSSSSHQKLKSSSSYVAPPQSKQRTQPYSVDRHATTSTKNDQLAPVFVQSVSCTCTMISDQRFSVTPTRFHNKLVDIFKSIPTRQYGL